jgi:hypothetical protein
MVLCVVATLALGLVSAMPFIFPAERVSAIPGFPPWLPFVAGLACWLACRTVRILFASPDARPSNKTIITGAWHDALVFGLVAAASLTHFNLKMWAPALHGTVHDELLWRLDGPFVPLLDMLVAARQALGQILGPWLGRVYHTAFLLGFSLTLTWFAVFARDRFAGYSSAIVLSIALGGFTYLALPAAGPFVQAEGGSAHASAAQAMLLPKFIQLVGEGAPFILREGAVLFTATFGAMPSLHVAQALIMLVFAMRARAWFRWPLALMFVWIVFEALATRWHYLIDLPPGLLFGWLCIVVSDKLNAKPSP